MSMTFFQKSFYQQNEESRRKSNNYSPLLVQIKIKNKASKFIKIANIHDAGAIDQEIKWFIQTNNLKQAAFGFIKETISTKIKENQQAKQRTFQFSEAQSYQRVDNKIQINITKSKHKESIFSHSHQKKNSGRQNPINQQKKEPHHLTIKLNTKADNIQNSFQLNQQNIDSFIFNSSFTLPSSIGEKQRSFLTDKLFENAFQTNQNHSENFQNISQIQQFHDQNINIRSTPLGVKNYQEFKIQSNAFKKCHSNHQNKLNTPRKPTMKITSIKQNKQNGTPIMMTPVSASRKKMISTKDRKQALMTPKSDLAFKINQAEFKIYDAQNLQGLVLSQQKQLKESKFSQSQDFHLKIMPDYLEQDLKKLFSKLTLNNPQGVQQLHSQYVSYQKLGRQELVFMGALFEKIDHRELNHLDFSSFKKNSVKYCFKELQEMHNIKYQNQILQKRYNDPTEFRIN